MVGEGGEERGKAVGEGEEGEEGEEEGQEELREWEAVKRVDRSTRYTAALPQVTYSTTIHTTLITIDMTQYIIIQIPLYPTHPAIIIFLLISLLLFHSFSFRCWKMLVCIIALKGSMHYGYGEQ